MGCKRHVPPNLSNAPKEKDNHVYVKSEISDHVVWSGKIYINTIIKVRRGGVLVIKPGTEIFFKKVDRDGNGIGDAKIMVDPGGSINAKGSYNKRILFTSLEKNPSPNDWAGIDLKKSKNAEFYQCDFRFSFWAFHFHFANMVIDHCTFTNNTGGMRFRNGDVYISNNKFKNNKICIRFWHSDATVEGNNFENNEIGMVFGEGCEKALVNNNNFIKNKFHVRLKPGQTDLLLMNNYWGTDIGEEIEKHLFHRPDNKKLGLITYRPYYKKAIRIP